MQTMRLLGLFILISIFFGCSKDDDNLDPISGSTALHYDGQNQSAPQIARGISYAAVRFPQSEVSSRGHSGKMLTGIDFYMADEPDAIRILVLAWNEMDETEPGGVLYEAILQGGGFSGNQWNRHELSQEVLLPEGGIWIAFEVQAGDRDLRVIGCDNGPHHPHGDVYGVFGDNLPGWTSLYDFTNEQVDINWNIRAIVK